jgi:hypothetical protein
MAFAVTNTGNVKTRVTTRLFGSAPDIQVTPKNTAPVSTTGGGVSFKPGQYVTFPGTGLTSASGPYINFGTQTVSLGSSGVSIKCTFMFTAYNTTGIASDNQRLVDFNTGANGVNNLILTKVAGTNNLMFAYRNGSGTQQSVTTSGFAFETGVVYTVIAIYDPSIGSTGQMSIYAASGSRVGVTPVATSTPSIKATSSFTYTSTYIGRSSYAADQSLVAQIYSLGVYKRVLGLSEIIAPNVAFVNAPYFTGYIASSQLGVAYMPATSNYTIALWIYWVSGTNFISTDALALGTNGTAFVGFHNAISFTIGGTIVQNTWQHVAIAYSAGSMRLFVNGVKVATTSVPTYTPSGTGKLVIGNGWKGSLDDFNMYPAALPDKACADLYSYETALTSDTPITANTYVCQDIGIQFGSNVFPTTSSPGSAAIFPYGPIVFRQTTRLGRSIVTPWFLPTKYAIVSPYTIAEDYSLAFWYYAINTSGSPVTYTLLNTPTLSLVKAGSNFTLAHTGSPAFTLATGVAVDNQWQHIVVTYESDYNVASIFINGINVGRDVAGGTSPYSTSIPLTLAPNMSGSIDDLRVYNGRLTDTDCLLLYNAERGLPNDPALTPVIFGRPDFTLAFGEPTVPTLTDVGFGRYAVTKTGAVTIRSVARNSKNTNSPFLLNGLKYLAVAYNLPTDFSVALWIYPTETTPCYFIDTTGITFGISTGNYVLNNTILTSASPFPLATWTHVTLTYLGDFNTSNLYVNGTQVATNVVVSGAAAYVPNLSSPVTFGGSFTGSIDNIRVYTGILPPTQVAALYAFELTVAPDPTLSPVVFTNPDMAINFGTGVVPTISDVYPQDAAIILDANRQGIPNIASTDNEPIFGTSNVEFFSTLSKYINTGPIVWNIATVGITIVADVMFTGTEGYYEGIFGAQVTSGGTTLDVGNAGNFMLMRSGRTQTFIFRMYDSIGTVYQVYSPNLVQNRRYIFACTFDPTIGNGTLTMYIDGTVVNTLAGVLSTGYLSDATYANNCVGCLYPGGYYASNMSIYEFAAYNRVLTLTELNDIAFPTQYTISDLVGLRVDSVNFEYTNGDLYIPFENSVTDVISNTPLTQKNNPVTYTTGIVGQSALFNGNTAGALPQQYYTLQNVFTGYPLSITFRFQPLLTTYTGHIVNITNGAGTSYFSVTYNSTVGSVATSTGLDSGLVVIGAWIYVAITVDSSYTSRMYINGTQVSTQTGSLNMSTFATTIVIGGNETVPSTNGFNGYLDELRMFQRALLPSEISSQYATVTPLNTWTRNVPYWPRSFVKKQFDPTFGMGQFGYSVALSGDHTTVLIGAPAASRAFVYDVATETLLAELAGVSGSFGNSVALNFDGSLCVVGAPTYNSGAGYAAVFDTGTGAVVNVLTGSGNQFGFTVSMSEDGAKVLVGTPGVGGSGGYATVFSGAGYATIVSLAGTGGSYYGHTVSLSGDGTKAFVSAPNDGDGIVRAFSSSGTFLNTITRASGAYGYFGFSLSTNSDGTRVAIGAPTANDNAGVAGVYSSVGALISSPIDSTGSYSQFGFSVALSGDGNTVMVGTPYGNVNDFRSGYAATFNAGTASVIKELEQSSFSLFGVSGSISYDGSYGVVGAAGPDSMPFIIDGSVLLFNTNQRVDTSYYLQGDYTVAGWSRWNAGTTMFSTTTVQIGTDGTRFIGTHNGTKFGIPDTITWPTSVFVTVSGGGTVITKTAGGSAWNGLARTGQSYTQTAYITAKPGDTTSIVAFGLSTATSVATPSLDYAWLFSGSAAIIVENGTSYAGYGTYTTSTVFKVTYDSTKISYYRDGQLQRTTVRPPGLALYGQANIYTLAGSFTGVDFGYNFSQIVVDTWQHVVFTYLGDYNISNIYVNGQLQAYIGTAPANTNITGPYTLGLDWQGYIDDIRTYTGVMAPDQVAAMYAYESTLPPEPTPLSYTLPNMALSFGTADVQTITSIGSYAVAITGSVVSHDSSRLQKSVATPYFLPAVKYLTVTSKSSTPSLTNPGSVVLSSNYTLADEQTFTVKQTNRNASNIQWQYTGVPQGLIVSSQTDFGATFKIFKGTTIPNSTFISVTAINPTNLSSSVVSFAVSVTDGIAVGGDLVTDINGRRIHIFTSASSTLTMLASGTVDMLLVGAGGGAGAGYAGGGGGAGGLIYRSGYSLGVGSYSVTVGTGGRGGYGAVAPISGGATSIGSLFAAIGGGAGATDQSQLGGAIVAALVGGSGGGGGTNAVAAGLGTSGQGYEGGSAATVGNSSGGGGGAGGPGGSKIVVITSAAGLYAQFGFASAISQDGTKLLVGAPYASSGAGYAALFNVATGALIRTFTSTAGAGAQFGSSVGISNDGSRVIVGAPVAGYAAVFNGTTGALIKSLVGTGNQFGFSVAISGDGTTAIAGTPGVDGLNGYVKAYTGATYATVTSIAYTPVGDEYFGHSVSVTYDGSIVLVGAPNKTSGSGYAAAFLTSTGVFYREFVSTADVFAYFGFSVAISSDGGTVIVGAPTASDNAGYAAVYDVPTGNIQSTMTNVPGGTSQFGYSVGLNNTGSIAIVSAPLADSTAYGEQGGYAALMLTSNGGIYRTLASEYPMTGASVSISAGLISAVGAAGVETMPFRMDGGVSIYF